MTSILIGVAGSERSEDAVGFGRPFPGAELIIACAFPVGRAARHSALRDVGLDAVQTMSQGLSVTARRSPSSRPRAHCHELQHALEVGHTAERAADLGRGLEAPDRALELVPALAHGAIQARVVDRDRGPVAEDDGLFVLRGELARVLLGPVEVPPTPAPR
jgi:hypothetical protein